MRLQINEVIAVCVCDSIIVSSFHAFAVIGVEFLFSFLDDFVMSNMRHVLNCVET